MNFAYCETGVAFLGSMIIEIMQGRSNILQIICSSSVTQKSGLNDVLTSISRLCIHSQKKGMSLK